jgi:hypothetical protein
VSAAAHQTSVGGAGELLTACAVVKDEEERAAECLARPKAKAQADIEPRGQPAARCETRAYVPSRSQMALVAAALLSV